MTVYAKTRINAAQLLKLTANYLEAHGRPRKPPYKPRPKYQGSRLSTPTALLHVARSGGFTPTARKAAEGFLHEAISESWPYTMKDKNLDGGCDLIWDTREMVRYLRRAARIARES